MQGNEGRLDGKDQKQQECAGLQEGLVVRRDLPRLDGEVGHVERAGDAIDQCHGDQEQRRGDEIDGDILEACA